MSWVTEIHHIDVGQGDSTLFLFYKKSSLIKSVLLDCGRANKESFTRVMQTLINKGVTRLDAFIISHWHNDHYGWYKKISKIFQPKALYSPYQYENFQQCYLGKDIIGLQSFDKSAPFMKCMRSKFTSSNKTFNNKNMNSLAFIVKSGKFIYLTAGDLDDEEYENENDKMGMETKFMIGLFQKKIPIHGFKVSHHGSSNAANWLNHNNNSIAFISAGEDDGHNTNWQHPTAACLDRLDKAKVLNTLMTSCSFEYGKLEPNVYKYQCNKKFIVSGWIEPSPRGCKVDKPGNIILKALPVQGNLDQVVTVEYYEGGYHPFFKKRFGLLSLQYRITPQGLVGPKINRIKLC